MHIRLFAFLKRKSVSLNHAVVERGWDDVEIGEADETEAEDSDVPATEQGGQAPPGGEASGQRTSDDDPRPETVSLSELLRRADSETEYDTKTINVSLNELLRMADSETEYDEADEHEHQWRFRGQRHKTTKVPEGRAPHSYCMTTHINVYIINLDIRFFGDFKWAYISTIKSSTCAQTANVRGLWLGSLYIFMFIRIYVFASLLVSLCAAGQFCIRSGLVTRRPYDIIVIYDNVLICYSSCPMYCWNDLISKSCMVRSLRGCAGSPHPKVSMRCLQCGNGTWVLRAGESWLDLQR